VITLFTKPGCQPCRATKRALDERGVVYDEVDVTVVPGALERVKGLGFLAVPVVVAGSVSWSGFRPDLVAGIAV
jgi:glutaredoxin-like protein NrdH